MKFLWRGFGSLSIRHKLLSLGLLPLLMALPLLAVILIVWGDTALDDLLITKVRSDLAVARGYFDRVQAEVGASTLAVAQSHALVDAVQRDDRAALARLLARARQQHALEFLELLPPDATIASAVQHGSGEGLARVVLLESAQFTFLKRTDRDEQGHRFFNVVSDLEADAFQEEGKLSLWHLRNDHFAWLE
jgi:hypothetical protein